MSLQFIIGSSGAGKSYFAYERVIRESMEHPERNYYIIVPEQFTMQTQKTLVEMHPGKGILNIDILSFERLAYRVFEETGGDNRKVLEDTGKSMVLQKMVQQHRKELAYLGSQMNKPGYLDEVKSLVSEFMQYDIREEELQDMLGKTGEDSLLHMKMQDVGVLYQAFLQYLEGHYMTGEGVMDALKKDERASIVESVNARSTIDSAKSSTLRMLEEHPEINVLVTFNEWTSLGVGYAIQELKAGDRIRVVAFDSNVVSVDMLESGEVDALIVQNPYAMGYIGVESAYKVLNGYAISEKEIDTETQLVMKDNMYSEACQRMLFTFEETR